VFHLLLDLGSQLAELVGIEVVEGEILQVALHLRHAETLCRGGVDLQSLLGNSPSRVGGQVLQGHHVVEPIGELDDDHPDVFGGCQQ
jgi:hypothetical protein